MQVTCCIAGATERERLARVEATTVWMPCVVQNWERLILQRIKHLQVRLLFMQGAQNGCRWNGSGTGRALAAFTLRMCSLTDIDGNMTMWHIQG